MQYFNIQVASQLSGVASATIRAWEKRYNAVVPERGDNKHRLYSEKDIEKLALLYKLTEVGQSIGKIAHLDLEELKQVYSSLLHRPYDELQVVTPHHERIDFDKVLTSFSIALDAYKLDIISHELDKAMILLSPRDLSLKLIIPLFHEIGKNVENGDFTIAQEHALSAVFSFQIGRMLGQHYQKENLKEDLILISTPEGELHEVGILASALLCIHYGIRFVFLGSNLPAAALAEAANTLKPKALLIGMIRNPEGEERLNLDNYLHTLISGLNVDAGIWLGGNMGQYLHPELEKRKITYFPTLESLDSFLQSF